MTRNTVAEVSQLRTKIKVNADSAFSQFDTVDSEVSMQRVYDLIIKFALNKSSQTTISQ
ncbi:hypothetical protein [Calothrix sp. UHCC 0171]|uniref:hypothetical protein n=1 Tax=Calothrix sp. UHCC 0171 TaxID=3110245 RepID=UPI002B1FD33B|nr:hypothetical protein [Calothrix sp. UHCC 0171]MEA5572422.1 hypothetical protein [Calothrix sp. UHCC 0171]